ncbi:hypothetical protein BKA56DRAFT_600355 [Ilyonectria sp. MPI-CAGE-AT-0026]|nr:hypothetical protein BKA56DRAFT_600355 [Ilyonectria sp. MPI-CAGE-AT-0026]
MASLLGNRASPQNPLTPHDEFSTADSRIYTCGGRGQKKNQAQKRSPHPNGQTTVAMSRAQILCSV